MYVGDGRHRQIITSEIFLGHDLVKESIETVCINLIFNFKWSIFFFEGIYICMYYSL